MDLYSGHINKLIDELAALPGIGNKSAQRLAFHMIHMPKEKVERLARTMVEAKEHVKYWNAIPLQTRKSALFAAAPKGITQQSW